MTNDIKPLSTLFAKRIEILFDIPDNSPNPNFGSLPTFIERVLDNAFQDRASDHAWAALYTLDRLLKNCDRGPSIPDRIPWKADHWDLLSHADGRYLLATILLAFAKHALEDENPKECYGDAEHWAGIMLHSACGVYGGLGGAELKEKGDGLQKDLSKGWGGALVRLRPRRRRGGSVCIDMRGLQQFREENSVLPSTVVPSDPASPHIAHHDQIRQARSSGVGPQMESDRGLATHSLNPLRTFDSRHSHIAASASSQRSPPHNVSDPSCDPPPPYFPRRSPRPSSPSPSIPTIIFHPCLP